MIYLDNAATSFPKSEMVYSEMDRVNRFLSVNAGRGSYKAAREASAIIDETRDEIAKLFNSSSSSSVVFAPSITIAINQVLLGMHLKETDNVYISPFEHNAVARCIEMLRRKHNFHVHFLPLQKDLQIDINKTRYLFSLHNPTHMIITAQSNVTGYILPVEELFGAAKEYGCITMVDTAQAAGILDIDLRKIHADILFFTGHKSLGGPIGIGGFILEKKIPLDVTIAGGTGSNSLMLEMPKEMPYMFEASSYNIVAIAGLRAALRENCVEEHYLKVRQLTQYAIEKLTTDNKVHILGRSENQLGIVSFVVDGYQSGDVGEVLDYEYGIAVRTGYHCCPYIHSYLKDELYDGTVRIGLGPHNEASDVDCLINALATL